MEIALPQSFPEGFHSFEEVLVCSNALHSLPHMHMPMPPPAFMFENSNAHTHAYNTNSAYQTGNSSSLLLAGAGKADIYHCFEEAFMHRRHVGDAYYPSPYYYDAPTTLQTQQAAALEDESVSASASASPPATPTPARDNSSSGESDEDEDNIDEEGVKPVRQESEDSALGHAGPLDAGEVLRMCVGMECVEDALVTAAMLRSVQQHEKRHEAMMVRRASMQSITNTTHTTYTNHHANVTPVHTSSNTAQTNFVDIISHCSLEEQVALQCAHTQHQSIIAVAAKPKPTPVMPRAGRRDADTQTSTERVGGTPVSMVDAMW